MVSEGNEASGKTSAWLSQREAAKALSSSPKGQAFNQLWQEIESTGQIDGKNVKSGHKKSQSQMLFCIHESEIDSLREKLNLSSVEKTSDWKTRSEFRETIGISVDNQAFKELWDEVERTGGIGDTKIKSAEKISGGQAPFCIHESEAELFIEKLAEIKAEESGKPTGKAQRNSIEADKHQTKDSERGLGS